MTEQVAVLNYTCHVHAPSPENAKRCSRQLKHFLHNPTAINTTRKQLARHRTWSEESNQETHMVKENSFRTQTA